MFAYFRINDPYRLISIIILLILIRLPAYISGVPLIVPELNWMLIGEKISGGAELYVELWDDIGPLSAVAYWFIDELFGRSQLAYQAISLMLIIFQSFILNNLLINFKAYNENTYIPALIYGLLACCFFDFYTLSPILMSLTFILLAINNLFYYLEHKGANNHLNTGMYIGIASLFYLPNIFFVIAILLSYLFFTGTSLKKYLLFFYGFFFPILLAAVFFYLKDGLHSFYINYIFSLAYMSNRLYISYFTFLVIVIVPLIFLALSFIKLFEARRYINIQVRYQQVMIFMMLAALIAWWVSNRKAPYQLLIFVPFAAFFISHFFLLIKKRLFTEIYFFVFFALLMLVNYGSLFQASFLQKIINYNDLLVKETKWEEEVAGKKTLFLGDNLQVYKNAFHATPYLNWEMSALHLDNIDYYDNLTEIFLNFKKDMPEVIIDEDNIAPQLFQRMPTIGAQYTRAKENNVYLLKQKDRQ